MRRSGTPLPASAVARSPGTLAGDGLVPPVSANERPGGGTGWDVDRLISRRLLIVSGKGGVGKTVVSAALAVAAARRGRRVLLAQFESNIDAGLLLRGSPAGDEAAEVEPGLHVVNMNPRAAIREYGMMIFRFRAVYRAVVENRFVRSFLAAMPGLDDYSMLGKVWFHATGAYGTPIDYDLVILDAPATGHLIKVLSVPWLIMEAVPDSLLTKDAQSMREMLTDPARCAAVIVTLAEELPTAEAVELHESLSRRFGIEVARLVVNQLYPKVLCPDVSVAAGAWPQPDEPLARLLEEARVFRGRRAINEEYLAKLADRISAPMVTLPLLFCERLGRCELDELAGLMADPG